MTEDELLNKIRSHFVVRYNTLVFKDSDGNLKLFSVDNLIYLCKKCYEEGINSSDDIQVYYDKIQIK